MESNSCVNCGDTGSHKHHIVPKSIGGTDEPSNLALLCTYCHGKVHDRDFINWKELQKKGIERAKQLGKYKGAKKKIDRVKVCYLNTLGFSTYKIADALHISRMSVHRILNEEGLKNVKVRVKDG